MLHLPFSQQAVAAETEEQRVEADAQAAADAAAEAVAEVAPTSASSEENNAAIKLQALQRGRIARKQVSLLLPHSYFGLIRVHPPTTHYTQLLCRRLP